MYDTLDRLPVKKYFRIVETGDIDLLIEKKDKVSPDELMDVWEKLFAEFSDLNEDADTQKTVRILKDVNRNETKCTLVNSFCDALEFEWDDELVTVLRDWGYTLREEHYYDDIARIRRESEALMLRAEDSRSKLPKKEDDSKTGVDDVLASYSSIMGFDFDYDAITCSKYLALKKQISAKIKIAEANQQTQKSTKNGK